MLNCVVLVSLYFVNHRKLTTKNDQDVEYRGAIARVTKARVGHSSLELGMRRRRMHIYEKRDLTQAYDKSPFTNRKQIIPKSKVTAQKRYHNFDDTTIADRLRTVSWSNDSH